MSTSFCSPDHIEICLHELNLESLNYLVKVWNDNPGVPLSIHINKDLPQKIEEIPKLSFLKKWLGSSSNAHSTIGLTSSKNILFLIVQFVLGGGAISYCTTFYFIYRVYHIAKKINNFTHWFGESNQDSTLEIIDEVERIIFKTAGHNAAENIDQYEHIIFKLYKNIDQRLKDYGLRKFFPHDPYLDQLIVQKLEE